MSRVVVVVLLLVVTAIWGWTFVVVRDAVHGFPVLPFLAFRFGIAGILLLPVMLRGGAGLRAGMLPGIVLSVGYLCQTAGLQFTTASKAGLFTGLFVVFTPLFEFAVLRIRPPLLTIFAVSAALTGTVLLAGVSPALAGSRELLGDGLEILTAIAFSVHMLLLSRLSASLDALRVALSQMTVATALFGALSIGTATIAAPTPAVWPALLITGVLASAFGFWVQTYAQQRISASRTAVVLVAEPAFATLFGFLLAGDRFTVLQATGAAFILGALFVHEAVPVWLSSRSVRAAG